MKFIHNLLKSQEKHFLPGGKLERLYPLFEAGETFILSSKLTTKKGPHIRDNVGTKRFMSIVILGLLPCTLFGIYNAGYQSLKAGGSSLETLPIIITGLKLVLPIIIVSYVVGGLCEALFSIVRKHEINEGFLVTGLLYPLTLPTTIPLWQAAVGIAFGVIIGKEVFGGSGRNFMNPALTARAFLFFTYPAYISGDVWISAKEMIDGFSGATALSVIANSPAGNAIQILTTNTSHDFSWFNLFIGLIPGSIGETSALCAIIGAFILLITRVASWRTMLGGVLGASSTVYLFNLVSSTPMQALPPHWHLVMGSFAFAIVFMATDPVSSPSLETSKLIYGFLIGIMGVVIRCVNPAYPEGWMLSILLLNVFAPTIDHYVLQAKNRKRIPNVI